MAVPFCSADGPDDESNIAHNARRATPRRLSNARLLRPRLRHPRAARRRRARPGHRRARGADPPDDLVRLREQRACRVAVQHGALGPRLQPHLQPDQRGARGARRRARRRRRRDRHRQRPGGAAPGDRHAGRRRLAHRRSSALYGGSHNLLHYTLARFGIETTFVKPGDIDGWRARDPARDPAAVRRDARQPGPRRARHPDRRPRSRTSTACRCWSTRPSRRRG